MKKKPRSYIKATWSVVGLSWQTCLSFPSIIKPCLVSLELGFFFFSFFFASVGNSSQQASSRRCSPFSPFSFRKRDNRSGLCSIYFCQIVGCFLSRLKPSNFFLRIRKCNKIQFEFFGTILLEFFTIY